MTTYTVGPSGCDETTIQAVFDNNDLGADDIIEVRAASEGGTLVYREEVTWGANDSGTSGHPVILRSRSGDTISISGCSLASGWTGPDGNGEYYVGSVTTGAKTVLVDGERIEYAAGGIGTLGAGEWYWSGGANNKLYYKPPSGHTPDEYTIEYGQRDSVLVINGVDYVTVENIDLYGANSGASDAEACLFIGSTATNVTITNGTSYGGSGHNIFIDGQTVAMTGHESTDCMDTGIKISGNADGITLTDCHAHHCACLTYDDGAGGDGGGIGVYTGAQNVTITECEVNNNGEGIGAGQAGLDYGISVYQATNVDIYRCNVHENAGGGIYFVTVTAATPVSGSIISCLIYGNGTTVSAKNLDGIRIVGKAADALATVSILNNTLYGNKVGKPTDGATKRGHIFIGNYLNVTQKNNIVSSPIAAETGSAFQVEVATTGITFTASNNCYYGLDKWYWGGDKTTLAAWMTASGETSAYNTDPLFVSTSDFHLKANSPCINAGSTTAIASTASMTDYDGNPLTNASGSILRLPDIGAYDRIQPSSLHKMRQFER